jgi:hypothetical protein
VKWDGSDASVYKSLGITAHPFRLRAFVVQVGLIPTTSKKKKEKEKRI